MKKVEAQHNRMQSQPAVRQGKGVALESPQGEQIAQLEAMAELSPQVGKQAQLAAMANSSSRMSAQRKAINDIHNSPGLTAQRQQLDSLAGVTAKSAQASFQPGAPMQFGGRDGDEWDPGPGQGEQAPPTPRPGQGGQERPASTESESSVQDGYSPRAGEERDETAQLMAAGEVSQPKVAQCADAPVKPNNTGLPDNLKSGIESLSGMSMDSVRVHYNSSQPAQLNALAYAQGTDIHVAPGQEQHLPHEAWHVVQQAQGRVRPTMQMKDGVPVNDDAGLEHEADVMGQRSLAISVTEGQNATGYSENAGLNDRVPEPLQGAWAVMQRVPQGTYSTQTPSVNKCYWDTRQQFTHTSTADNRTVVAPDKTIAVMRNPPNGGAPSVDPEGWAWLRAKFLRLKGDWVRFHMINAKLGGPGNDALNLLPTTHVMNHDSGWRNIEEEAKTSAAWRWTYLEVTPSYDQAYPAGIPRSVSAEWGAWTGSGWKKQNSLSSLSQQNPALAAEKYGDASALSLGELNNLIRSYMPAPKQKRKRGLALSGGGIKKKQSVTSAYKVASALKLLNGRYYDQSDLDKKWDKFIGSLNNKTAENVWYKIQNKVYLNDEAGLPPYSLVFRKA